MRLTRRSLLASLAATWAGSTLAAPGAAGYARLASGGRALMPIVTADGASAKVKGLAASLADVLGRMSGSRFDVVAGDGAAGIAVGTARDFPRAPGAADLVSDDPARREDYAVTSHSEGIHLVGATELGASHAVWDTLHRLGYRQYFPGRHWEIVPAQPELALDLDIRGRPDYFARRIWYSWGAWDYAEKPYAEWCAKNRATSGIELNTGHAYDNFIAANKAAFDAHPEYLALVGGVRKGSKLCISNPDLRRLVTDTVLRTFAKTPTLDTASVEPSDGGGWCECADCARLGSITDRAVTLANDVAVAVSERYPGKRVGMYAYYQHSPPPTIAVHPAVVVSIATAFLQQGWTLEKLIAGWSAKAQTLGIREYYSINTWDRDRPAAAKAGDLAYLGKTISAFHGSGARFMSAESGDGWAPNGLGYYAAARMLWDVREADRIDHIRDEFLTLAFGPAKAPMAAFYGEIDGSIGHFDASAQMGLMFASLRDARALADTAGIRARIDDLTLYARYVDLLDRYALALGPPRQAAFEALIRHAYRMRTTEMVHAKALYRDLIGRDKTVKIPSGAEWNVAEEKNPWKSSAPFANDELAAFITEGIARHRA